MSSIIYLGLSAIIPQKVAKITQKATLAEWYDILLRKNCQHCTAGKHGYHKAIRNENKSIHAKTFLRTCQPAPPSDKALCDKVYAD